MIYQKFSEEDLKTGDNPCSDQVNEYFLGSIIVCPEETEGNRFELIDGQQRLTTIFLFAKAITNFANSESDRFLQYKNMGQILGDVTRFLNKELDYYADSDKLKLELQYENNSNFLKSLSSFEDETLTINNTDDSASIKRMKESYNFFFESLKDSFLTETPEKLSQFCRYFLDKVKFVFVKTSNRALALKVFGTLNNRGKSLSALDLLKNLIFLQMQDQELIQEELWQQISEKWKVLTDSLDKQKIKPEEFLRYVYLAHFNEEYSKVREDDVYNLLEEHFKTANNQLVNRYLGKPTTLIDDFLSDLNTWTYFKQGKNIYGDYDIHLQDLFFFSPKAKQHIIILLSGRKLDIESFKDLTSYVEDITFIQTISSGDSGTKKFEPDFAQLSKQIRRVKGRNEFQSEILPILQENRKKLAREFESKFTYSNVRKSKVFKKDSTQKYILGKFEQFMKLVIDKQLEPVENILRSSELEHILPQQIPSKYQNKFDEDDIYQLGNLTLINSRSNKVARNNIYEEKKTSYSNSNFYITKFLVNPIDGKKLPQEIKDIDLITFDTWSRTSIEIRQNIYVKLANKVWINSGNNKRLCEK